MYLSFLFSKIMQTRAMFLNYDFNFSFMRSLLRNSSSMNNFIPSLLQIKALKANLSFVRFNLIFMRSL